MVRRVYACHWSMWAFLMPAEIGALSRFNFAPGRRPDARGCRSAWTGRRASAGAASCGTVGWGGRRNGVEIAACSAHGGHGRPARMAGMEAGNGVIAATAPKGDRNDRQTRCHDAFSPDSAERPRLPPAGDRLEYRECRHAELQGPRPGFPPALAGALRQGRFPPWTTCRATSPVPQPTRWRPPSSFATKSRAPSMATPFNMDVERSAFAENSVHHQASVTFINGMLTTMQRATQGQ